jgi:hypothetical protein
MSPSSRLAAALAIVVLAGIVISALLIHGAMDRLRVRGAEADIDFVLTGLRQSVESSVALGLPLDDLPVAQDLIERARADHPEIVAVEIFSADGVSLYNTDRGSIGAPITEEWRAALRRADASGRWRVDALGALVVGAPILNDFGEPVGYLAVTRDGAARAAYAARLATTLAGWAAVVAVPGLVLAAGAGGLLSRRATRDLRDLRDRLAEPVDVPAAERAHPAEAMRAAVARAVEEVDRTAEAVRGLDEDAPRDDRA